MCTEIVFYIQNNFCTQHFLQKEDLPVCTLYFFYASILGIRLRDLSLLSRIQNHRETKI